MSGAPKSLLLYRDPSAHAADKPGVLLRHVRQLLSDLDDQSLVDFHPNDKYVRLAYSVDYSHEILLRPISDWSCPADYYATVCTLVAIILDAGWEVLTPEFCAPVDYVRYFARPVCFPLPEIPLNVTVRHWWVRT